MPASSSCGGASTGSFIVKVEPLPELARHRHVAAHHLAEAPREAESQPGAAVFARRRGVGLRERLEELAAAARASCRCRCRVTSNLIASRPSTGSRRAKRPRSRIVPRSVNLQALLSRLKRHWRTFVASECIVADSVAHVDLERVAVLLHERMDRRRHLVDEIRDVEFSRKSVILPASILARSRMSLMRPSRCLPAA